MSKPATERLVMKAKKDYVDIIGNNLRNNSHNLRNNCHIKNN